MKKIYLLPVLLFAFIINHAQNPTAQWASGFGSGFLGTGQSVATDAVGNVYTAGYFTGQSLTIGGHTLINEAMDSAQNMFVAKFDSLGNNLWAQSAGGGANEITENVTASGLGADAAGNVYVLGSFQTPIAIFGNDTLVTNNDNTFLVKYNTQGNVVWAINVGGTLNNASSIAVDANGNSYIAGSFTSGSIIGGADTIPFASNVVESFVMKYDSSGHSVWAAGISGDVVFNDAVAFDAAGNVYITGGYSGASAVVAPGITLTNTGASAMYTVKYNKTGHAVWAQNVSVSGNIFANAIAPDAHGNVFITGSTTSDTLVFGPNTALTGSTSAVSNFFIAAYDSSGNNKWVHCTTNNNDVAGSGISADADGNVFVTGAFDYDSVTFGNFSLGDNDTLSQLQALFIAEYNAAGNVIWATGGLAPKTDMDGGASIEADNNGHLYVSGNYAGNSVSFGNDTLPFAGNVESQSNVFIAKYSFTETGTGVINAPGAVNNITIYPNPSSGSFCFKGLSNGSTIEIYNVLGQNIYSAIAGGDTYLLNIAGQAKGVYLYRIVTGGEMAQQGKMVLQ